MKNRNTGSFKYVLMGVLFAVTAVLTFVSMNIRSKLPSTTTMAEATLPIVMMETDNGTKFNELHGYTCDIDETLFNESLTPLPSDRKLSIAINTYGQEITGISYKIRSLKNDDLIEDTKVTGFDGVGDQVRTKLNIKNLIEDNVEYSLEIILKTKEHESVSYYTKVISAADYKLQDKINFVMEFNGYTFDQSMLSNVQKYIETSSAGNNGNYGKVNINSKLAQIGWGDLNPFIENDIIPTIKEINSEVAIITMDYTIGAENDYGSYDTYSVNEYYRIRQSSSTMYLLNYEREANQIFDARNDLTSSSKINLGIESSTDVTTLASDNQKYTYFVNQGNLWCYSIENNVFTKAFSFDGDESDNIREHYNRHNIKIIDVDDSGNVDFLVSGYMNRGAHEGEVGVSVYSYDYNDNIVNELLYIPMNIPYEILSQNVGEVSYISNGTALYILIDSTLYSIDIESKETMTEITGLSDNTYSVSEDGRSIAYSTNGELNNTDTIRIFNTEKGTDYEIKAEPGEKLKVLGYIKNDFIYGTAYESDIVVESDGNVTFPMYKINIIDTDYNEIKEYKEDGIYVSAAEVDNLRINLTRIVKDDGGNYENTSIDQLINRDESGKTTGVTVETISTSQRLTETVIVLTKAVSNVDMTAMRTASEVVFNDEQYFEINSAFTGKGRYYVYGYGKFQGSYQTLSKAISKAYDTYGSVTDYNNSYIWKRYRNSSASISGISSSGCADSQSLAYAVSIILKYSGADTDALDAMESGKTAIAVINETTSNKALNLKGVSLDNVLSLVSSGYPVIGRTDASSYAIIMSYDSTSVTYIDVASGASKTLKTAEASKTFSLWGNTFISYYK